MQAYSQVSTEQLLAAVRIGLVMVHPGGDRECDHLQLDASSIDTWKALRHEVG